MLLEVQIKYQKLKSKYHSIINLLYTIEKQIKQDEKIINDLNKLNNLSVEIIFLEKAILDLTDSRIEQEIKSSEARR